MADTTVARARAWIKTNGPNVAVEAAVNFIGPYLIYTYAKPHLGEVGALLASSGPPIVWSLVEFARHRRLDVLSALVLGGIGLSLLAMLGGGGVKWLQLRERLVTVVIGLVFLGSAAIGKPIIYELARARSLRGDGAQARELEALKDNLHFRRVMMVMTVVWGAGLLVEAAINVVLVFTLTVEQYLLVHPIVGYAATGLLVGFTFLYARHARARGMARRAAEAAAAAEAVAAAP
ncbi:MAG TPA: VC0807 family protein, partial [Caulobacteraceae bacterium]|nr:VC0807 family protein [Caulobacteraceae bacterium]